MRRLLDLAPTRLLALGVFVFLAGYSVAIASTEWRTSQEYARNYLDDIAGDVTFYLVNTTLSVFLLWATAVLLVVAVRIREPDGHGAGPTPDGPGSTVLGRPASDRWFLWSQAAMFAFLGVDDRFQFHEKAAFHLGEIPDHYVLGSAALLEVVFIALWADTRLLRQPAGRWFVGGGILFAVMLGIDALFPEDMRLRLSMEDLAKTWAAWLFFLFGWHMVERELVRLRAAR